MMLRSSRKALNPVETPEGIAVRRAEVEASPAVTTEATLHPPETSNSWWPSLGLWSSPPDRKKISYVEKKDDGSRTSAERGD